MRVALISDLHGNMPAVEALEQDLYRRGIDRVWCLGDLVGKGPSSDRTFDWVVEHCEVILRGNWDEGIGRRLFPNDKFYYRQLGEKRLQQLSTFPLEKHVTLGGRKIRLLHGRPVTKTLHSPHGPADVLQALFEPDFHVVVYADTHRQALRTLRGTLCNIGSVGNGLGVCRVQYGILEGPEGETDAPLDIQLVTVPYDVEKAVADTLAQPELPNGHLFIQELRTGVYAR